MLVTILSGAATLFIGYLHWQERHNHPLIVNGLGLILGGAIGNLIDRSRIFFVESYTPVSVFGYANPNTGSISNSECSIDPSKIAVIMERVF